MFASHLDDSYTAEVRHGVTPMTVAKIGANSAVRYAAPFIATVASGLHVSLATVGAAIGLGELVGLGAPLIARLAAQFTRRAAMISGLLGIGAGATVCATSRGVVQFAIGLALMNVTKIVFDLGIISWLTDRVEYGLLGRAIGLTETAWAIALLIGVVLMGLVTGIGSWRWGYALAVVFIVAMAATLRAVVPDESRPAPPPPTHERVHHRVGAGWLVIVATVALTASAQAIFVTFGKWLQTDFTVTDTQLSIIIFGLGAIELAASSAVVRFLDIWGKQRSSMFGAAIVIPSGLGLAVLHHHFVIGLVLLAVYVAAFEFAVLATISLSSGLVPGHPSVGLGLMVGAGTLGRAVMASPATAAFTAHGMWAPSVIGASCAAVTVGCQWRYRAVRTEAAVSP